MSMVRRTSPGAASTVAALVLLPGCYDSYQVTADSGHDAPVADVAHDAVGDLEARADAAGDGDAAEDAWADVDVAPDVSDADADTDGRVEADGAPDADADADADAEADGSTDVAPDGDAGPSEDAEPFDDADSHDATDADSDAGASDDGDVGGDAIVCDGAWQDPTSGALWEDPPTHTLRSWDDAVTRCDELVLCGEPAGTWRLPTVSELRSFMRGCAGTVAGGACGVTDSCLGEDCAVLACTGCSWLTGPGARGCYWDPAVSGAGGCGTYWSSSGSVGAESKAWTVSFSYAFVQSQFEERSVFVRCLRR
ncbi:MAG: DUF1566 domain-containing protein [Deltaproteobacteria bacterium]|nr:DUF1566 domain-containing protein [Deltaproteobacteria bacterium]